MAIWQDLRKLCTDFWRLVKPFKRLMLWPLAFIFFVQTLAYGEPLMISYVVDGVAKRSPLVRDRLPWLLAGIGICLTLLGLFVALKNRRIRALRQVMLVDLYAACAEKFLRLPLSFHQKENAGLLLSKATKGISSVSEITELMLYEIIPLGAQILFAAVVVTWLNWRAMLVLLPICALFSFITVRVKLSQAASRRLRHELDGEADALMQQAVAGVQTVQSFCQEEREVGEIVRVRMRIRDLLWTEFTAYDKTDVARNGVVSIGRVLILFFCATAAIAGGTSGFSLGILIFVTAVADRIMVGCYRVGSMFDKAVEAMAPVGRLCDVLDAEVAIKDPPHPVEVPDRLKGLIEFDHVWYRYDLPQIESGKTPPDALEDVSFRIEPGETIGIIGGTGSGKSTLAKLLKRFGDPYRGSVLLDGVDVRKYRLADLRRSVASVDQDTELLSREVWREISYGLGDIDVSDDVLVRLMKDVCHAASVADASGFISNLPKGFEQRVGNRGTRLSAGQRQRIGIARAIYMGSPILLFDEATSDLDVETERHVLRELTKKRGEHTIIVITHRLATVRSADRIIVMENGRIIEQGPPKDLLQKPGVYRKLVEIERNQEALR